MKSVLFVFLFIETGFAFPDSHLLDPKKSTILSSVGGLVNSVPTLLNNPVGVYLKITRNIWSSDKDSNTRQIKVLMVLEISMGIRNNTLEFEIHSNFFFQIKSDGAEGLATVAAIALNYGLSCLKLSKSIDNLTAFIRKSTDESTTINQYIVSISGVDDLIPAAICFAKAVRQATDMEHNLDFFKVKSITDCLSKTTDAQYDISASIQVRLEGAPAGPSIDLRELTSKIDRASEAMQGFADVADNVQGVTAVFFGVAANAVLVDYGLLKLSERLHLLASAISDSSDSTFNELVRALHGLAETEKKINVAFQHLAYLT